MSGFWKNPVVRQLGRAVAREAPRLLQQLSTQRTSHARATTPARAPQATTPAPAPVPSPSSMPRRSRPTRERARRVAYAPELDGHADPGEVVWTWVEYEEDASQGKDRPVLVVGREGATLLGLMLSSQDHGGDRDWLPIGSGAWDSQGRESWVRLDRVIDVPEKGIRREGAILGRGRFDAVAEVLREQHGWS
ncbi:type II toxin-antitoxin system PemK/MazF family toxin [Hoyosella sp. G463]|uniref:Type II toxin-antitoxin system PemK/MazF family toxin n=1 Tax=Lolliginicoccus lacisalsi TaxID=2742202 RepID=A0A927PKN0_9ACTN|nr:type II toxin-antitoxin system PemK/MazF family toxin [Lolliginicoccus lacisalsi]MBD8506195.1 type II toxin-antitoxin system PemK/MazF family toxin [Lolliginicoccus lacisalsi]